MAYQGGIEPVKSFDSHFILTSPFSLRSCPIWGFTPQRPAGRVQTRHRKTKKNFRKALKQRIENPGKHVSKKMCTLWLFNIAMENDP